MIVNQIHQRLFLEGDAKDAVSIDATSTSRKPTPLALGIDVLAKELVEHDALVQSHGEENSIGVGSISFIAAVGMRVGRIGGDCNLNHRRFIHTQRFIG